MILLNPNLIQIDSALVNEIEDKAKSIFRSITFCKKTSSKNLLDAFINSTNSLTELLSIKNAQMEAETEDDLKVYQRNLNKVILFIINEIKNERPFESQIQLFHIFRLVSPEAHKLHPNRYRDRLVQIGGHLCPEPERISDLVTNLFFNMEQIQHPLIKAIYLHHEMIRIHPFVDGNGRITRIAKNWILMYNLYPPIFIKDEIEKKEYIESLSNSFKAIERNQEEWHTETSKFFQQELNRVILSINYILEKIKTESK
jgi:Fic family protein